MKLIIFSLVFFLSACSSVIVKQDFPAAPTDSTSCQELVISKDSDKLSDLLDTVTTNYRLYHDCQNKNDIWLEWYKKQKAIYDSK